VLAACGYGEEAQVSAAEAARLFEEKGNLIALEHARQLQRDLSRLKTARD
jgi:hypothetical protein